MKLETDKKYILLNCDDSEQNDSIIRLWLSDTVLHVHRTQYVFSHRYTGTIAGPLTRNYAMQVFQRKWVGLDICSYNMHHVINLFDRNEEKQIFSKLTRDFKDYFQIFHYFNNFSIVNVRENYKIVLINYHQNP